MYCMTEQFEFNHFFKTRGLPNLAKYSDCIAKEFKLPDLIDNFNQIGNKFIVFNDTTTRNAFGMHQSEVHIFRDALFRKRINLEPIMYGNKLSTMEVENDQLKLENAELKKQVKKLNSRVQHMIRMLDEEEARIAAKPKYF